MDATNGKFCESERCGGSKRRHWTQQDFVFGNVAIFDLKRFHTDGTKIHRHTVLELMPRCAICSAAAQHCSHIAFPEMLDLHHVDGPRTYHLRSVLEHRGDYAMEGHWVSCSG